MPTTELWLPGPRRLPPWSLPWASQICPVASAVKNIVAAAARRFEDLGTVVEEAHPDLGDIDEAFQIIRAQVFAVEHENHVLENRDLVKADVIWNTEKGLAQTPSQIAWADRERAAYYRRVLAYFDTYDLLLCPVMAVPAFDVNWRYQDTIDGVKVENYIAGSLTTSAISMTACPAMSVPAGVDE